MVDHRSQYPKLSLRQFVAMQAKPRGFQVGDPNQPGGLPVMACVNAAPLTGGWKGRWIARCECGGAEYVDLEDPIFFCLSCGNSANEGAWRPVVIPEARVRIERILEQRPGRNQNWEPGETLEDLRAENARYL